MYQLSVFVHVVSAVVWVGGMLFLALVIAPATRQMPPAERGPLFSIVGRRFRTIGWLCIALLIATGIANVAFRGVTWGDVASGRLLTSDFGRVLTAKLAVIAVMIALSLAHDLLLGPASAAARPDPVLLQRAAALRRRAALVGRVNTLLALLVLALAVALVRGLPW
ncbi:MAG: DUF4149 domain-containing protein [Thermomicrobiales bacterium]|nr:DUF4149 domain-containing protein [Thermomicrobiales bacterium]